MKTVIISLGGSVVNSGKLNSKLIKAFGDLLINLNKKHKIRFGVVVGGGKLFRNLLPELREYTKNKTSLDWVGIYCTRVNAQCVASYFIEKTNKTYETIGQDYKESAKLLDKYQFVFQGGDVPGHTSDMDTIELAIAKNKAKVINISNVDGVYDKDPNKYKSAKKIPEMTHKELSALILKTSKIYKAGQNLVFDQKATKLAQKYNIELHFISANNLKDVEKIIQGKAHKGTIVKD
ncbi:UMP kinase [Candidatus Micrarchaeota archaeon]|jgi:uridylate kinase|nr:UMP kinase [Candidatus Micrarchaeota archaeon]